MPYVPHLYEKRGKRTGSFTYVVNLYHVFRSRDLLVTKQRSRPDTFRLPLPVMSSPPCRERPGVPLKYFFRPVLGPHNCPFRLSLCDYRRAFTVVKNLLSSLLEMAFMPKIFLRVTQEKIKLLSLYFRI